MTGLAVEIRRGVDALHGLHADWQRLWQAQSRREVFTSHAWCMAACQAAGQHSQVCIVLVRRGTLLVGLLPLSTTPARFLSGTNSDYNDMLVCDAAPAEVVAAALQAVLTNFDRCVLDQLPEWSTMCQVFELLPPGLRRQIVVEVGQPCPALRLAPDRDVLLAAMTGKQSLKRHEKKLARHGALRLRHIEGRDAIRGHLDDFFAQHVSRRALAGGRSLFLEERSRAFYHCLVEQLDPATELRFAVLEVDGRAAAYHFGFELDGRFTWYKPSFDVDYWDCGVGEVLLKRLLEYVRDRSVHEFDFTRGDEAFKDRFSNHQGRNVRWTLSGSSTSHALTAWRSRIRLALKSHPGVVSLRHWVAGLATRFRPASGSRPGRTASAGALASTLGVLRIFWWREELLLLSSTRDKLVAQIPIGSKTAALSIERGSLRNLAMLSVARDALLDFDDLQRSREALQPTDRLYIASENGTAVAAGWVGERARLQPWIPALGTQVFDLEAPATVIQFIGNAWPAPQSGRLGAVLAEMVRETALDTVWIACPPGAASHLSALREAGFRVRHRLGGSSLFSGPWYRWSKPV